MMKSRHRKSSDNTYLNQQSPISNITWIIGIASAIFIVVSVLLYLTLPMTPSPVDNKTSGSHLDDGMTHGWREMLVPSTLVTTIGTMVVYATVSRPRELLNTSRGNTSPVLWMERSVRGDGECFFRSVAVQLHGDEHRFQEIKNDLLDYVEGGEAGDIKPGPILKDYIDNKSLDVNDIVSGRKLTSVREQLSGSNKAAFTEASIFALVSELYKVKIVLEHDVRNMNSIEFGSKYTEEWRFIRKNGNHFNPIVRANEVYF